MTPERIAEDLAEAWNQRDLDAFLALLTDDVVWDDPAMREPASGKEAVRQFSHALLRAFPDFRYEIRHPICTAGDGTRCAVPWRITGTHSAALTPPGYAPTGRRADFQGVDLIDVRDGRACRIVTFFNVLVPAEQLLAVQLRPRPGGWRERGAVWAQRVRAAWLRTLKRSHSSEPLRGGGQLNGTARFKEPIACTEEERREFARLVRQGFDGSDEGLHGRIRDAKWLAFYYAAGDTLAAIAALKAPDVRYRGEVFKKADAPVSPADYRLELGWVFVIPTHRGNRIAENLCQPLLARASASCVFATTRPNNIPMIRILLTLGFARAGKPYPRRNEELVLFLRSGPTFVAPGPAP